MYEVAYKYRYPKVTSIQSWKETTEFGKLGREYIVGVKSNRFLGTPIHWDLKAPARTRNEV
jgi:hypothetical protein